jgi:hypothetical protein
MSGSIKLGLYIIAGVFAAYFAVKIVLGLLAGLLQILIPIAIIGGIGLILYGLITRKSLGGGSGRSLP